jgi:sulfur-oxidizing protein SoxA
MIRVAVLIVGILASGFAAAADIPPGERRSGFDFMTRETQAMQQEDALNPGMLWVADGEAAWTAAPAAGSKACTGCHGDAVDSMRGVAARYPAFDDRAGKPVDLQQRINACRERHQQQPGFAAESRPLLGLAAYIGLQSRGLPAAPAADARLDAARARGEALFRTAIGQLNFSCAQCHDDNWGRRLAGSPIPQGHPTGYPIYRLEWQGMGSLQRRLRNCMTGVRAEPFAFGAAELVELELYLATRAAGMPVETPAVRP